MLNGGPIVPGYLVEMARFDMSSHLFYAESLVSFVTSILRGIVHEWWKEILRRVSIQMTGRSTAKDTIKFMSLNEKLAVSNTYMSQNEQVYLIWNVKSKRITGSSCSPALLCLNSPSASWWFVSLMPADRQGWMMRPLPQEVTLPVESFHVFCHFAVSRLP